MKEKCLKYEKFNQFESCGSILRTLLHPEVLAENPGH